MRFSLSGRPDRPTFQSRETHAIRRNNSGKVNWTAHAVPYLQNKVDLLNYHSPASQQYSREQKHQRCILHNLWMGRPSTERGIVSSKCIHEQQLGWCLWNEEWARVRVMRMKLEWKEEGHHKLVSAFIMKTWDDDLCNPSSGRTHNLLGYSSPWYRLG